MSDRLYPDRLPEVAYARIHEFEAKLNKWLKRLGGTWMYPKDFLVVTVSKVWSEEMILNLNVLEFFTVDRFRSAGVDHRHYLSRFRRYFGYQERPVTVREITLVTKQELIERCRDVGTGTADAIEKVLKSVGLGFRNSK